MNTIIVPHGFEPNYTLGFVKGLQANGIDLCVVSSDADAQSLTNAGIRNVNLRGSVDEQRPALAKIANLLRYYASLLAFLAARRGATVHFTGILRRQLILVEALVLPLAFRLLSARFVYTAHNALPHGRHDSRMFRAIYRMVYRLPQTILVHTRTMATQLAEQFDVPRAKIQVISIGVNEEVPVTALTREDARALLGLAPSDRVVLFFGKIEPYKGLDILLQAFESPDLAGVKLVVAGAFQNASYRDSIMAQIAGSRRSVDLLVCDRSIPNDEVERYFKSADVLVLPYRQIYQSGVLFLSMRFGTPVISTAVGSLPDYIDEEMGIVTERNDADGVSRAIARFFEQQQRYRRESISARSEQYRWEAICREIAPLYP